MILTSVASLENVELLLHRQSSNGNHNYESLISLASLIHHVASTVNPYTGTGVMSSLITPSMSTGFHFLPK